MNAQVQKIKDEIERLKKWQPIATPSLEKLKSFIEKLPEEPVSVNLVQELKDYFENTQEEQQKKDWEEIVGEFPSHTDEEPIGDDLEDAIEAGAEAHRKELDYWGAACGYKDASCSGFREGAKWMKEQMMKNSFNAVVIPADYEGEYFSLMDYYDEWPEKFGVVECISKMVKEGKLKNEDKVKVIIVKQ